MPRSESIETVVIGGGQAGLAMSFCLRELGREHVILERARVAESWRTQRWDSLMFQFPNRTIELPGSAYAGADPDGFMHKDGILHFLETYAKRIEAPMRSGVNVRALRADAQTGRYLIVTDEFELRTRNVVIATGPYQRPRVPTLSSKFPAEIVQLHASKYRNPRAMPDGSVLVVGSGASGCQIADELVEAGRRVYLAVGRHSRFPRRYRGRDFVWWSRTMGMLDRTADAYPEAKFGIAPPVITGVHGGYDIDLRRSAAKELRLLGHIAGVEGGQLRLSQDLEQNLRVGDQAYQSFQRDVDEFVSANGIDAPLTDQDRKEPAATGFESPEQIDLRAASIRSVIWATGYAFDFSWVQLPVFDDRGYPVHRRGVTSCLGLYFLGLAWLHKLKSAFLAGVGDDARYLADCIAGHT